MWRYKELFPISDYMPERQLLNPSNQIHSISQAESDPTQAMVNIITTNG